MGICPDAIKRLIDRFEQQSDQVRSPDYNETQLRIDFINPLMRELGWDIDNAQGFAEQYREVVHEDRVKVAGQTKAPDYSFRVGGARKFFLEAKKPAVDIKNNWEPAYQLRRYAWSAKLTCSLLTDFEEFAIYDARIQPKQLDKASTARREYIHYTTYCERWDFLAGTFSKDAVLKGEFDRYCETKKSRGAQPFDDAFLGEIEDWRKSIASSLARNNEALDEASLNFAVQRIIDRIIFLRIAEDRGTETVGQLQGLLNADAVYPRLVTLFRRADERYNSGLFHFAKEKDRDEAPDTLTPTLSVDDKTLKGIIKALYYPQSPYEFTMVSADILGSIYERFLGKIITLTASHNAKIEEKPQVRKAGGVYYTPTYIVDYIVKNTVGKLLEGKTPKDVAKIKALDPACGSGSFLIGAYQYLLDWYRDQYTAGDPSAFATGRKPVLRPGLAGGWALTIAERKRILLDHIHGVDLDGQAVEVTKLNLLLKCLEGETSQTLGFEQRLFRERALPDLGKNILCGNSLIGTDIAGTAAWEKMTRTEQRTINPFDYKRAFQQVFNGKAIGFDAVIGNPPYVRIQNLSDSVARYLTSNFRSATGKYDLYLPFVERALEILNRTGRLGFILPNKFFTADYGRGIRTLLIEQNVMDRIIDFQDAQVFEGATTYTSILLLAGKGGRREWATASRSTEQDLARLDAERTSWKPLPRLSVDGAAWHLADVNAQALMERLGNTACRPLSQVADRIFQGLISGADKLLYLRVAEARERRIENALLHPVLKGKEVRRYAIEPCEYVCLYPYILKDGATKLLEEADLRDQYPNAFAYLSSVRRRLEDRGSDSMEYMSWYAYWCERDKFALTAPKIVTQVLAKGSKLAFDEIGKHFFVGGGNAGVYGITMPTPARNDSHSYPYILGILNSKVVEWFMQQISSRFRGGYFSYAKRFIERVPIPMGRPSESVRLASLVDSILALHKRRSNEVLPQQIVQLQREIEAVDDQIDNAVYQLYGLNEEQIALVEHTSQHIKGEKATERG